jgi:hypothetical protein
MKQPVGGYTKLGDEVLSPVPDVAFGVMEVISAGHRESKKRL